MPQRKDRVTYQIRYRPDTDLGRRFDSIRYPWRGVGIEDRVVAEELLRACVNAASMEIVEVDG